MCNFSLAVSLALSHGEGCLSACAGHRAVLAFSCYRPVSVRGRRRSIFPIKLRSLTFGDGQRLPERYTADGADVSPALSWDEVPAVTKELALVCDDPDAPGSEPWVHWLLYKIPPQARVLRENLPPQPRLQTPEGILQGRNSWTTGRTLGYRGPAPPPGKTHRYRFRLYALDAPLDVDPGIDKGELLAAMHGHIVGEGQITATYSRQPTGK